MHWLTLVLQTNLYLDLSIKRQIRMFQVLVVQWTSKKWTKKRDTRAELLFWSLNLLFFWSRRCGRRRSCLSSLISAKLFKRPSWMQTLKQQQLSGPVKYGDFGETGPSLVI